jgi:hypothetical protein
MGVRAFSSQASDVDSDDTFIQQETGQFDTDASTPLALQWCRMEPKLLALYAPRLGRDHLHLRLGKRIVPVL